MAKFNHTIKITLLTFGWFLLAVPIVSSAAFFEIWEANSATYNDEYSVSSVTANDHIYTATNRSINFSIIRQLDKKTGKVLKELKLPNTNITDLMTDGSSLYVAFKQEDYGGSQWLSTIRIYDLNLNYIKYFVLAPENNHKILDYGTQILVRNGNEENGYGRIALINKAETNWAGAVWYMYPESGTKFFDIERLNDNRFIFYGSVKKCTFCAQYNFLKIINLADHAEVGSLNMSYYSNLGNLLKVIYEDGKYYTIFSSNKLVKISLQDMYKIDGWQDNQYIGGKWRYDYIEPPATCPAVEFDNTGWTSANKNNGADLEYCAWQDWAFSKTAYVKSTNRCLSSIGCFLKSGQVNPISIKTTSTFAFGSTTLVYSQPSSYQDYYFDKDFDLDGILDLSDKLEVINYDSLSISNNTLTIAGNIYFTVVYPKILRIQEKTGFITSSAEYRFLGNLLDIFDAGSGEFIVSGYKMTSPYSPLIFKFGPVAAGDTIRSSHITQFRNFIDEERKGVWVDPVGIGGKDRHANPVNKLTPFSWSDPIPTVIKSLHFEELRNQLTKIYPYVSVSLLSFSSSSPIKAANINLLADESEYLPTWHNQPNLNLSLCKGGAPCPDGTYGKQWRTDKVIRGVRVSGSSDDNGFCHVFWHTDSVSVGNFRSGDLYYCENANGNYNPHLEADQYGVVGYCLNTRGGDGSMGSNSKTTFIPPGMNIYIRSMYSSNDAFGQVTCNVDLLY